MQKLPGVNELWAIVDSAGLVLWSRGGSSTARHLLVYDSEPKATRSLTNSWLKQVLSKDAYVKQVYVVN